MTNEKRWQRTLRNLDHEFRQLTEALEVILQVDREIFTSGVVLDKIFHQMLLGIQRATGAEHVQILLRQGSALRIAHSTEGSDIGRTFDINECVCGIAVEENRTVAEANVRRKYPDRYRAVLGGGMGMQSEIAVPIRNEPNGTVVGVLNVEWPTARSFHAVDVTIVEQIALQAGAALHSGHMREVLEQSLGLARVIHSTPHREAIREALLTLAATFPHPVVIQFLVLSRDRRSLSIEASTERATEGIKVLVSDSVSGVAVETEKAVLSDDVRRDFGERFKSTVADYGGPPIKSELAVPIIDAGHVIGVLNVESPEPAAFSEWDQYVVMSLAGAGAWHRFHDAEKAQAMASMAVVGDVAANLVHIVTNGLLPIYETCQRLRKMAATFDCPPSFVTIIDEAIAGTTTISNRVAFLRNKYERSLEGNAPFVINDLVRRTARAIVTRNDPAKPNYIEVVYDLDESIGTLTGPPAIEDAIWNLVSNAKAAIPEKQQGRITITTQLHRSRYTGQSDPETLEIRVTDNGVGIPKDRQTAELYTLKKKPGARGFGLWWVKTFVDRCDGAIELQSDEGRGASFRLTFPLSDKGEMRSLI